MSFSSNKTKQKAQQSSSGTSTTTVDPWSKDQFEKQTGDMTGILGKYTSQPFRAYDKPMVAGMSDSQKQFQTMAQGGSGASGLIGDAVTAANEGGSRQWTPEGVLGPDKVSYRTFDKDRVRERYNPYESDVVDSSAAYFDQGLQQNLSQNNARATQSGAFGGSRHGVADAELMRSSGMDKARMMADLRYRGYNDAMAGDERETQGIFGADQYNSGAGYQARMNDAQRKDAAAQFGVQQKFNQAGILSGLASQKDASFGQQATMLAQAGATDREIEQAKLLAARAEFDREAKDQLDKLMLDLQLRQGILSATPMGQTTTSSGTGQSSGTTTSTGFKFAPNFSTPFGGMTFGGG